MARSARGYSCFAVVTFIHMVVVVCALSLPATHVLAVQPDEVLKNTELEKRARKLSLNLRCLVCQNQSIDDSDAPLARDLRLLVRERLVAGDSDDEVVDFLVARYGEFVLLKPTWGPHTLFLWLTPLLVLGIALFFARGLLISSSGVAAEGESPGAVDRLSKDDEERLRDILDIPPSSGSDR